MNKTFTLGMALAMAVAVVSAAAAQTEVRYGLWAKEGEAQHFGALKFKEIVEAETQGRYRVTIFPDNQLGTPREMLAQLALDTTQVMASGDPGIKDIEYLSLPYLMRGMKNYETIINGPIGESWNKKLVDERQVRLLGFMPRSPRQISANKVVNSMADLKGMKLRAPQRDYYVESLAALGAKPTPMAFAEVYTALQTGIVDGQENPVETIYAQKFFEVQTCIVMIDYIVKPAYVMIGDPFWNSLPDADKALFKNAAAAAQDLVIDLLPKQEKEFLAEMQAAGVTITYPDKAEFIAATKPVREKLGAKVWGKELYEQVLKIGQQEL